MKFWAAAIGNLTDGRYFAAYNAAYISFVLDSSHSDYIAPNVAAGIAGWLEGPQIVGVFGNSVSPIEIKAIANTLHLDAVQVDSTYDLYALAGLPIVATIAVNSTVSIAAIADYCAKHAPIVRAFYLDFSKMDIDFAKLQKSELVDYQALIALCATYPIWLHCALTAADIPHIAADLRVEGLVLQGGEEDAVGLKSFDELDEIVEAIDNL